MRQYLTGSDLFAEMRMVRNAFEGTILVLEGATDCRLLDAFVDKSTCRTCPGNGKDNVLTAMKMANSYGFSGALGVVDADFDHLDNTVTTNANVLTTDFHDIEIYLFLSGGLDGVLREFASDNKLKDLMRKKGATSAGLLLFDAAYPMGVLRWISGKKSLALSFEGTDFKKFIDKHTLDVNVEKLITHILNRSEVQGKARARARREFEKHLLSEADVRQVCCGHDVAEVLAIGLRWAFGSCNHEVASPTNTLKVLRIAFGLGDLKKTSVYNGAQAWENNNKPFKVFAS